MANHSLVSEVINKQKSHCPKKKLSDSQEQEFEEFVVLPQWEPSPFIFGNYTPKEKRLELLENSKRFSEEIWEHLSTL